VTNNQGVLVESDKKIVPKNGDKTAKEPTKKQSEISLAKSNAEKSDNSPTDLRIKKKGSISQQDKSK
jgi:hypothetical protein